MSKLGSRLKRLEQFEYGGNKIWYAQALEGVADEWELKLMLTETGKVIDKKAERLTFDELIEFKEKSEIGVFFDILNAID